MACKDHIDRLRQELTLNTEQQRRRIHKALQLLSEELYSSQDRALYELLQNADDSQFPKGTVPTLRIVVTYDGASWADDGNNRPVVVVISNETGFTPENVASLCDIAASTKVSSNELIGEKGIGFKCLFRLSSSPRVYSNGYQFSLSSIPDDEIGYGYIVPRWLSSVPPAVGAVVNAGGTAIVLPTRSDTVTSLFLRTLAEVSSTAIMFLSQLQEVTIEVPGRPLRRISLRPLPHGVHNPSADTTLESLMVSGEGERLVMRLRCNETPPTLPVVTSSEARRAKWSSFRVNFALPLASSSTTGLYCSFLVPHADIWLPVDVDIPQLILTANRESLIEDSPWNEWLLLHVLPLAYANCLRIAVEFISSQMAWDYFPFLSDFSSRWALLFLWLPELPSRKHRRFRSLVRRVLEETSHASFIPVCSDVSQLCLKAPSCCSVAPKDLTPNIYTLLIQALRKSSAEYLVLPELLNLDCEVHHFLDLAGCDVLSVSEVLRYLSKVTLDSLTPADLAVLYNYCFKEGKGSVTVRSELASMPLMMATDGSRHCLASTSLQFYWPDERFLKTIGGLDAATLEVVSIVSDVAIVHSHLVNGLSSETITWLGGSGMHNVFDEEAFARSLLQGISNAVGSPLVHHGDLVAARPRCWNSGTPDPHYLPQFLQLVERCSRVLSEESKRCERAPLVVDLRNQPELHRHLFPFLELGQHNWLAIMSPKSHGASIKAKDMRLQLSFSDLIPETFLSANCLLLAPFYNDNPTWVQENFPVTVRLAPSPPDRLPPCKSLSELLRGILVLAISGLVNKEHSWDFLLNADRRISWRRALGTKLLSEIRTAHMFPDQTGRLRPASELVDSATLPTAPLADALHVLNPGIQEELKLLCHDIHGRVQKFLPSVSAHRISPSSVLTKFLDHLGVSGSFSIAVAVKVLSLVSKLHPQVLTVQACAVVLATCEQVTRTQEWLVDKPAIRTNFASHPLIPVPLDVGSVRSWIRLDKEVVWADPAGHFQSRLVALEHEMPLHVQQKLKLFFDGLVSAQPSAELYAAEWTRLASGLVPPTKREQAKLKRFMENASSCLFEFCDRSGLAQRTTAPSWWSEFFPPNVLLRRGKKLEFGSCRTAWISNRCDAALAFPDLTLCTYRSAIEYDFLRRFLNVKCLEDHLTLVQVATSDPVRQIPPSRLRKRQGHHPTPVGFWAGLYLYLNATCGASWQACIQSMMQLAAGWTCTDNVATAIHEMLTCTVTTADWIRLEYSVTSGGRSTSFPAKNVCCHYHRDLEGNLVLWVLEERSSETSWQSQAFVMALAQEITSRLPSSPITKALVKSKAVFQLLYVSHQASKRLGSCLYGLGVQVDTLLWSPESTLHEEIEEACNEMLRVIGTDPESGLIGSIEPTAFSYQDDDGLPGGSDMHRHFFSDASTTAATLSGQRELRPVPDDGSVEFDKGEEVGMWGEEFAFEYVVPTFIVKTFPVAHVERSSVRSDQLLFEVNQRWQQGRLWPEFRFYCLEWVNGREETGAPYDLRLKPVVLDNCPSSTSPDRIKSCLEEKARADAATDLPQVMFEVKTTRLSSFSFTISANEMMTAERNPRDYVLLVIANAGKPSVNWTFLDQLSDRMSLALTHDANFDVRIRVQKFTCVLETPTGQKILKTSGRDELEAGEEEDMIGVMRVIRSRKG